VPFFGILHYRVPEGTCGQRLQARQFSVWQIGGMCHSRVQQRESEEGSESVLFNSGCRRARMDSRGIGWYFMQRQCAWCLRFMDHFGEPISAPQPKRYEVSHGMCCVCGSLWLEQAIRNTDEQKAQQKQTLLSKIDDQGA